MELSWNRGIGNSYVYNKIIYGTTMNTNPDFSLIDSDKWKDDEINWLEEYLGYHCIEHIKNVGRKLDSDKNINYDELIDQYKECDPDLYKLLRFLYPKTPQTIILMWEQFLLPKIKRPKWNKEEDEEIRKFVTEFGVNSFSVLESLNKLNGKTAKQIRDRWNNYLAPLINKSDWTSKEDELLKSLVNAYGKKWGLVSKSLFGRSGNSCKNRYIMISNDPQSTTTPKAIPQTPIGMPPTINTQQPQTSDSTDIVIKVGSPQNAPTTIILVPNPPDCLKNLGNPENLAIYKTSNDDARYQYNECFKAWYRLIS